MIGLYLIYESVMRFIEPQGVDGWLVVIIAAIALVVDWITALLTYRLSKESINIRAAFLHNVADALGSIAVILAGSVIIVFGWNVIDPLITLLIAGYVLFMSIKEGKGVIRMLMLAAPSGFDRDAVVDSLSALDGVINVHHVHVWEITERQISLEAHVVVSDDCWSNLAQLKANIRQCLEEDYHIEHSTIEFERVDEADDCSSRLTSNASE